MIYISGHYLNRRVSGLARYAHQVNDALVSNGIISVNLPKFLSKYSLVRKISLVLFELLWPCVTLGLNSRSIYISPSFSVPIFNSRRVIVVVHDLAFIEFPECYSWSERLYYALNLYLAKIFKRIRIVVPSDFVRCDLIDKIGISRSRISVINPYSSLDNKTGLESNGEYINGKEVSGEKYILLVSNGHPRKNLKATIDGYLKSEMPRLGVFLYLVGTFESSYHQISSEFIRVLDSVSDEDLISLYRNAYGAALFSLNEGFGIPVVEASNFQIPCIHSNNTGLNSFDLDFCLPKCVIQVDAIAKHFNTLIDSEQRDYYLKLGGRISDQFCRDNFDQGWVTLVEI
ncbi:MAG: glycosyltransferase involved in cell wall biosynthesis [Gammaproteobacteria bacterium]|jgi:glycosyltransferase involved in cell wall biosynthesis